LHGESAGTAAALLGAVQFGLGALTAPFVGALGNDNLAMALVIAASTVLASAVLWFGIGMRVLHAIDVEDSDAVLAH
jgi:DHA1 family bicyclomycin/chloramphenicol resistance-like MFS transporter